MQAAITCSGLNKNYSRRSRHDPPIRQPLAERCTALSQVLSLGLALLLTLAAGLFYYSWQTARLTEQVAAQTALLTQIQATRANTLVKAADPLPTGQATASPATLKGSYPRTAGCSDRWP